MDDNNKRFFEELSKTLSKASGRNIEAVSLSILTDSVFAGQFRTTEGKVYQYKLENKNGEEEYSEGLVNG